MAINATDQPLEIYQTALDSVEISMDEVFISIIAALNLWLAYSSIEGRYHFWSAEVKKVRQGGYVPPEPYFLTNLLCRSVCFTLGFLEVGPIKIVGKDRVPESGPRIIAPFHIDAGDASIVSALIGISPMYYLIRTTEVLGYRGWIATMTGAIAVDEETQEGRSKAFKAAVSALSSGGPNAQLVIFPQGQLVPDEVIRRRDFKSGTMAIAKICARRRKEPIWIVPVGVHYKTDPAQSTLFQKAVQGLGFKKFRNLFGHQNYGAFAVVGRPFKVTPKTANLEEILRGLALEDDAEKATDTYVKRLALLQKSAMKHSSAKRA